MNWTGKKVLVTGAGGFIGSHLAEALVVAGARVTAMIRYSGRADWGNLEHLPADRKAALQVISGNVEDPHFMIRAAEGQEVIFHLAALITIPFSYLAPTSYVRTNVEGTLNVLEAARIHRTSRVVHTSTSETYGTAQYTPIDEKHPMVGQSPYSASKIGADKVAESYWRSFQVPVATLRPFNAYGPRQSARAVIPTVIAQALARKQVDMGELRAIRDLTFVRDTVAAYLAIAGCDAAVGQTVNAGTGKGIPIGDLARLILSLMNREMPIVSEKERMRPETSEVFELVCDHRKAAALMGWSPMVSLRDGLRETIDFVERHLDLFKPEIYGR
jgi:NAD dependent epimerase/dehydratase